MRRAATLAVLAAALFAFTSTNAANAAQPPNFNNNGTQGAQVTDGVLCGMPNPNGFVLTDDSHFVITPSGSITLTCHGELPGAAKQNIKGILCGVGLTTTTDSHLVWTPSGQGTLTCHAHV